MPYITQERREELRRNSNASNRFAVTAGELNYIVTHILIDYVNREGLNYQRINDVIGALEGAKLEFYRRVVAPYESAKMAVNGDVYP
jgi:hypothetical protein